jgi:hypothetical protein
MPSLAAKKSLVKQVDTGLFSGGRDAAIKVGSTGFQLGRPDGVGWG